ncbi:AAA family ATPase [Aequorivita xiaoshiensis]|uniref:AAA family ATPase n=1 Tax=Aequorivita xiaoshiensis TaxID=2874476 RepID=A0A9X1R4N8_9FLAO|nr:AAA family ATPase [Aequorivita xiaoshiensis]MCG2431852.1 AAA family ATPase [Aequorivita xiaoshiensis]
MEFFTDADISLVHSSGDKEVNKETHRKLVEVYKKLEHLCKLLKKHGFEYEIRKDPRSQGGGFKYFQTYQWAKVYPPGFIEHCRGKFSYIIGVSSDVHFHMMGIGNYQNKPASVNASEMSSRQTPHQNSSYEVMVQDFLGFDKSNRDLFTKTGAELGIEYCQHIMEENNLNDIVRILKFKNQIILQGPPGTGKTRLAKELINKFITVPDSISNELIAKYLNSNQIIESPGKLKKYTILEVDDQNKRVQISRESGTTDYTSFQDILNAYDQKLWENSLDQNGPRRAASTAKYIYDQIKKAKLSEQSKMIQFHPSYTYEDFVRGITAKPNQNGDGIFYENENKTLGLFAKKALENYLKSKNLSTTLSKELWLDDVFNGFIQEIAEDLGEDILPLTKKVNMIGLDEDAFRYKGKSWESNGNRMLFRDIKQAYLDGNNTRQDIVNNKSLAGLANWHATYFLVVLERFKKYLIDNTIEFNPTIQKEVALQNYVLVIDEINRANLPSVLGELIYALEYRGEEIDTMYEIDRSRKIIIPPNLYIIGTMNTADRSVGHIDYAIRRRFSFVDVLPNKEVVHPLVQNLFKQVSKLFVKNYDEINWANPELEKSEFLVGDFRPEDVWIGHSYFITEKTDDAEALVELKLKLQYEIKPLLKEYVKDGILTAAAEEKIKELDEYLD